jgi:hypothetical protein
MNRNDPYGIHIGRSDNAANRGTSTPPTKSNSRRYFCPQCKAIVRATREVNVICGDCMVPMVL